MKASGLAAALALVVAAWSVVTIGFADRLAAITPERALALRPGHAFASLEAARRQSDVTAAAALARRALHADPLDGRAYRRLADLEPSRDASAALLAIAVARAPRDLPGQFALASRALERNDYAAAIDHFDRMLLIEPELMPRLAPTLGSLAMTPAAQQLLADKARRAQWRAGMLDQFVREAPDVAAIAPVYDLLRPLSERELGPWVDRLANEGAAGSAYLLWVDALPKEQRRVLGNVFDGGFEWPASGNGFGWRFGVVPGAAIERAALEGMTGQSALHLRFDHRRVPFRHVSQRLALPPGPYRFEGRYLLDALQSDRGLVWRVICAGRAGRGKPLATSEPMAGGNRAWRTLGFAFAVPEQDCDAQLLELHLPARIAAEQRIGGNAWFDDIRIIRADR